MRLSVYLFRRCINNNGRVFILIFALSAIFYSLSQVSATLAPGYILSEMAGERRVRFIFVFLIILVCTEILSVIWNQLLDQMILKSRLTDISSVQEAGLNIPLSDFQKEKASEKMTYCLQAVCSGNDYGVEAYLSGAYHVLKGAVTLLVFLLAAGRLPLPVFLILVIGIIIRIPFEYFWQKHEANAVSQNSDDRIRLDEVRRELLRTDFAKDVRLYQAVEMVDNMLKRKTDPILSFFSGRGKRRTNKALFHATVSSLSVTALILLLSSGTYSLVSAGYAIICIGIITGVAALSEDFIEAIGTMSANRESVERFCCFMQTYESRDSEKMRFIEENDNVVCAPEIDPLLKISDLSFSYGERTIIKDLCFQINSGEKIAIVGRNGVGKSTLIHILTGSLLPDKGEVSFKGKRIEAAKLFEYHKRISVSMQDVLLLPFTLGENITCLPEDKAKKEDLLISVRKSGLQDLFDRLPNGFSEWCTSHYDENGISFSEGEKQRIMIARMLYRDTELYLLDEPTAALDAKAEAEVYNLYRHTLQDKTCIFVSHRLGSLRFCDRILFMEDAGHYTMGTFDELYHLNPNFKKMYGTQKSAFEDDE